MALRKRLRPSTKLKVRFALQLRHYRMPPSTTNKSSGPHGKKWLFVGLALSIALLLPFPTTVVPEWKIRVVDWEGKPLTDEFVRQSWTHYSLESCCGDIDDRWTDENGYVVFPERLIWASLLRRALFPIWARVMTIAHGSEGIAADVVVWGKDTYSESVEYKPNQPLPDKIVLSH